MNEIMTIEEMKERYPEEWVLIGDLQIGSPYPRVLAGRVLAHSKDREAMNEPAKAHMPGPVAVMCFRDLPPGMEYLL